MPSLEVVEAIVSYIIIVQRAYLSVVSLLYSRICKLLNPESCQFDT